MAISTDVLNATNGTTTSSTGTTSSKSKNDSSAQAVQDRFLKLLVAQLNNQDPMNPLDNAQMTSQIAQLNTVTGIENLNSTVGNVLSQMASMQALQGAAMVGREVLNEGSTLQVSDKVGRGAFDLSASADKVKVEVRTASGTLVDTIEMNALPAGRHTIEWDASKYSGSEALNFTVTPTSKNTVTATALQRSRVESVSNENNVLTLQLAGGKSLAYSSVKAIL
ncbi:flagellar hook assembly protein FlgD [Pseudorhodoferax sp. Leaf274]|uniref:flagellar hook assembly protein FlgD n=1 Tax=Pseudorhodoferax sp. Leaf274 TaxID=1736318 RepID=UPI0007029B05|nr:flagellar hook capping FlgD N-terminal domain-containing protein [Pseudorhodoferax sp. Leaf274]KQP45031.1 flagellar biosynthesis protein FlgD [Pseudorhodoferax sp. Leaf274]